VVDPSNDGPPRSSKGCVAPPEPAAAVRLVPVFENLKIQTPVALVQAPRQAGEPSGRWFALDQHGLVHSFFAEDGARVTDLQTTDLTDRVAIKADGLDERGLLGIALHPRYPSDRRAFVGYTFAGPGGLGSRVSSFVVEERGVLDASSERVLLELSQPYTNHNGGNVAFGPDGYLYIGFGDGGAGGDPQGNGQNPNTLLGAMLRIDIDAADAPYGIPQDNPYAQSGGRAEIFAIGLRNPWRYSFDRQTGELWVGDVGQDDWEEVDVVELGKNYGWNSIEGFECFPPGADDCERGAFQAPVHSYVHEGGANRSVTGGYVYRGAAVPELAGSYVFGDFNTGEIFKLDRGDDGAGVELIVGSGVNISSFAEDHAGELYVLDYGGGRVLRIDSGTESRDVLPRLLSQTGCVDVANPKKPTGGAVAYDVAVPFWSDGVEKHRYLVVPADAKMTPQQDGDLELPPGSVLIKHFEHDGRIFETRFYVRHDGGGYSGYSYAWREDGSDAELVERTREEDIGDLRWIFPGRESCGQCHTAAAGYSLGLDLRQLDVPSDDDNQLAKFADAGLLQVPKQSNESFPRLDSDAPLSDRARAYLHVNCSSCHRPGGPGRGGLDLLFETPLANSGLCEMAQLGALGTTSGRLVAPGNPEDSVLYVRVSSRTADSMPPLATKSVDPEGAGILFEWIESLSVCP